MDSQDGNRKKRRTRKRLKWFYLNGELHKKLHINIPDDVITTWNYPQRKRLGYSYRDVKRRAEPAFTTAEAGRLLNRKRLALERAILRGDIEAPQMTYGLTEIGKPHAYMWSEQDIINAHNFFKTVHKGRPRKDGLVTPMKMPSLAELRALIREENVLYERQPDGTFVPTWKAEDF